MNEDQLEIGGAQALLQLGTKLQKEEDLEENHLSDINYEQYINHQNHENHETTDDDKTNQQITDAVEAAVMRFVGGTLDTDGKNRKTKRNDDVISNLSEYQWDKFLADEVANPNDSIFDSYDLSTKTTPKKKRKRVHTDIDPELSNLNSNETNPTTTTTTGTTTENHEHDQLVQAAIMGAGELAKQLGSSELSNLPPNQAHQVLMAASNSLQQHPNNESISAINQLAQAASSLSNKRTKKPLNKKVKPSIPKPKFNENTSIESLIQEASEKACNWFNSSIDNSTGPRPFSQEEINAVDHFVAGYCHLNKLSRQDVCNRVWSNERTKDNFWESLTRVLPYRSRASVYKHVKRQYHIFQVRAKWSVKDDEILNELATTKIGNWKEIGEIMNRMPEDCRDRWRNYVKCGQNRALNKWSIDEETKLKDIVVEMISNFRGHPIPINWTLVSEKMNGQRSRIQCRYKWNKLMKRETIQRIQLMNNSTKLWLLTNLQNLNFQNIQQINWDSVFSNFNQAIKSDKKLNDNIIFSSNDLIIWFDKIKSAIKDHKNLPLDQLLDKLINHLYNNSLVENDQASNLNDQLDRQIENVTNDFNLNNPQVKDEIKVENDDSKKINNKDSIIDDEATSIANAAVAAVSASVNDQDAQHQEYSLWR